MTALGTALPGDAGELFTLQRACWVQEQQANPGLTIPALTESLADVQSWLANWTVLTARRDSRLIAAARAHLDENSRWDIGRLMVAPDLQGQGLGRWMLSQIEAAAPVGTREYVLFTGAGSAANIAMYQRAGYRLQGELADEPGVVWLLKTLCGK